MPVITLPDGSKREYDQPVTAAQVAADIGPGLVKAAVAARFNGQLVDTAFEIDRDGDLAIVTAKDDDGLEVIRHSAAHLMAQAVKRLYPEAQVTIGPVIENGFYYDFAYEPGFKPEDMERIQAEMGRIVKENLPVERTEMDRDEAVKFFRDLGEEYKAKIIEDIPAGEVISLYRQGDFIDLCRGPHVPSTGHLKANQLTRLAGAYWRGDSDNEMLQRIYGTAWADKKELETYLHRLAEAERRDHRKLGKVMDLFHQQPEAPGMVFWHDRGWTLWLVIENYIRRKLRANGYEEIRTPQILDRSLWEKSGHWEVFAEGMFTTHSENRDYALKPMNCPGHIQVFNQGLKSYRDLPIRLAEFGSCIRNEASGTLHGLMRVRGFVQDDAHIFCTEDQIQGEVVKLIDLCFEVYRDFGFEDFAVEFSTRPEKRVGDDALWDRSEAALKAALDSKGLDYQLNPGDGAFYGPKIDFVLKDSLGRDWQLGTVQLDFSMPGSLGAEYVAEDGSRQVPVMLHRAILGSLERFIGVLIEHYGGQLPLWLAPVQAAVLNITDRQAEYARKVVESLGNQGFRVISDLRNEKIGYKIRGHTIQKVPYLLVVGDREVEAGSVAVRARGEDQGSMPLQSLIDRLDEEVTSRGHVLMED